MKPGCLLKPLEFFIQVFFYCRLQEQQACKTEEERKAAFCEILEHLAYCIIPSENSWGTGSRIRGQIIDAAHRKVKVVLLFYAAILTIVVEYLIWTEECKLYAALGVQ